MEVGEHLDWVVFAILSAFIVYSLLTKAIARTVFTLPMVFVAVGYALSDPLAMAGEPALVAEGASLLAEITLILVLFSDASKVRFMQLRMSWKIPTRMLLIGMPLTIAVGTLVVYGLNPASGLAMALLTAAVLTPTDAALGQSINVESGLNDGLAFPFVLIGAILASADMQGETNVTGVAALAIKQVLLGPLAGIAVGWVVARAMDAAQDRDLIAEAAEGVVFLSTAFTAYLLAEIIGGNGFIAAFVAGMVFGNSYRHDIHFITEVMEGAGQLLTMSAFLVFGAILLPAGLAHISLQAVLIALAFLTVVRMAPIFLSLAGLGLRPAEKLFLGWFGPRGLASVLFTLLMIDAFDLPNEDELLACVSMTVLFSVIAHGLSAAPLARRIGRASPST